MTPTEVLLTRLVLALTTRLESHLHKDDNNLEFPDTHYVDGTGFPDIRYAEDTLEYEAYYQLWHKLNIHDEGEER